MAIIKCKMCGGDIQLAEDKTFGTCEYCGSVMTLPKISDEQRAAAFNRGNHFRRKGEFDKALSVYERIVAEDDNDAEAHWCCALCRFGIEYVEDPATYEWLPTCHRASFDSFLEDVDYKAALEHSDGITRRQYQKDAAKIAEVQRGILAASQNTEPYDVFISYKELDENGNRTRDSILAQDIYYQLQDKGWRVFFSRISLEDVPGTEYEPYIFAALNSAKVMVVVGTSAENLNAVWVKNEWSRYLSLMRKDRSRLLIPCYRDMDPYDLPEQLSVLASYDMGKIGFIQDLIRGVDKVLSAEKPREAAPAPAPVQERVIVQQSAGGPNVTALLKRGQQSLEDGDWEKAKDFYDQVLSMDAENADAFLGLALAASRSRDTKAYLNNLCSEQAKAESIRLPRDREHIDASLTSAVVPGYCERNELASFYDFDVNYPQKLPNEKTLTGLIRKRFDSDRNLARAFRYAQGDTKQKLEALRKELNERLEQRVKAAEAEDKRALEKAKTDRASKLKAADENTQERSRKAQEKREAEYQEACRLQESAETETDYWKARTAFINNGEYKDAEDRAAACAKKHQQLKEEKRAAEEREEAEHQKASRKIKIILAIVGAAAIAFVLLLTKVIIPGDKYTSANALFEAGEYQKAATAFYLLGNYSDARERSFALWSEIAQRESVSAAQVHTVGLRSDGTVVAVGSNRYGQCDVSDWTDIVAVAAGGLHTVGLRADGTVLAVGTNSSGECDIGNWTDIVAIAAGQYHTVGLRADGTVVAVGENDYGKCYVGNWTDIVAIAAGNDHTVGLLADGTVVATGNNEYGQRDVSDWTDIVAIAAGSNHTVGLRADGTVLATGSNGSGVDDWKDIVAIATGPHAVGLRLDGTVVAVGSNSFGECKVGAWTDIVGIATGTYHTVGLRADGTVVAVGSNDYGECNVSKWKDIKLPKR